MTRTLKTIWAIFIGLKCKTNGCLLERWHRGAHYGIATDGLPCLWKNKDG